MAVPFDPADPPRGIALVATDLDGTFLDPSVKVSARSAAACRAAIAAGLQVVPVTARPPHAMFGFARAAGMNGLGVCLNGAVVVDLSTEEVLTVDLLLGGVATRLVEQIRAAIPEVIFASDTPSRFEYEPGFLTSSEDDWEEETFEVPDIVDALAEGTVKLIARVEGWSSDRVRLALEVAIGAEAHATSSNDSWVELSAPGVTKALGLQRVCDLLGIRTDAVVTCGDNLNDLAMLAFAGTGCAVASGHPLTIEAADLLIPSNAEDGVAQLLEALLVERSARPAR